MIVVFSSFTFLFVFFPITIILYYIYKNRNYRNIVLLIMSLVFYAWGEPKYILLMVFSIFINYILAIILEKYSKIKKIVLNIDIAINILLIFIFKYLDFGILSINKIFNTNLNQYKIALPIGISFYTFQILSYVIDVYRKDVKAQKNIFKLGLYISLFPQLIAGPIVRYKDIEEQINNRNENLDGFVNGLKRFIIGLGKKVIIANNMALVCDTIYNENIQNLGTAAVWIAVIAYAFQIYFDFSGYSDMAIGIGKIFGFDFLENFNYPYISTSVTEFWRRWHISLSRWFRDYVYIPLGGNRCSKLKNIRNILIVWTLTGLWHGSNYNYVIWGIYYGVLLIIEKFIIGEKIEKIPKFLRWIITMIFICVGWVIFRIENLRDILGILNRMFIYYPFNLTKYIYNNYDLCISLIFMLFAIIGMFPIIPKISEKFKDNKIAKLLSYPILLGVFGITIVILLGNSYNPFIYFKF